MTNKLVTTIKESTATTKRKINFPVLRLAVSWDSKKSITGYIAIA